MNGPLPVYHLKPAFKIPEKIEVPSCVYRLNKIQSAGEVMKSDQPACGDGPVLANILEQVPPAEVEALHTRWDVVLQQLADLKNQMVTIRNTLKTESTSAISIHNTPLKVLNGAVINASVQHPPYSLLLLQRLCKNTVALSFSCHIHSTVSELPENVKNYFSFVEPTAAATALKILIVWKQGILDSDIVMNPIKQVPIQGEVNILRLLARLGIQGLAYDTDEATTIFNDSVLDTCHRLAHVKAAKEKQSLIRFLNAKLGKSSYFGGENINISDLAAWSVLKQIEANTTGDLTQNMTKWFQRIESCAN